MAGAAIADSPPSAREPLTESPSRGRLRAGSYESLLTAALLLIVFVACGLTPMQGDTWWQLRAGRDMWASGSVMLTDVYSHTAQGAFWSNHEWLAEVVFFGLYRVGGLPLLTLFAAALISGGWMLAWRLTRGPARPVFGLTVLALVSSAGWWEPRPHAFSLLFIPLTVSLVASGRLAWLPLVFLAWANTHGGVLLGFVLLAAALAARTASAGGSWPRPLLTLAACGAAMTATPLGLHFWVEIPRSLARIRLYPLDEWMPSEINDVTLLPFWAIAGAYAVGLAWHLYQRRPVSPSDAAVHACAALLLPAAVMAVRNVGPFLMLAVPGVTYLWRGSRAGVPADPRAEKPVLNIALTGIAASIVVLTLTAAYRAPWARLEWQPLPPDAIAAVRACPGNLYNRYDEGGMLLWFAPERLVFLDGRQDPFPPALVLEHVEMETGARPYGPTFARHDVGCAFLPDASPVAAALSTDGWTRLYRDDRWTVLQK